MADSAVVDLDEAITPGQPSWADYPRGVMAGLLRRGLTLAGAEVLFDSNIPLGGGLSSSAALAVAASLAMLVAADAVGAVQAGDLAKLCQQAEHEFAGAPVGIMDQSISLMGRADTALLLDCRSGRTRHVPFDAPDAVVLVCDTRLQHANNDGGYAARRSQCEAAVAKLGIASLRDATIEMVAGCDALGDIERKRARHVVSEIARTVQAAEVLDAGDLVAFGELMYASHASLRDDYEVSCPELDAIVDIAGGLPGVFGARMTGGGFGGCAIVLVRDSAIDDVRAAVLSGFAERFGQSCATFATRAADGATVLGEI